MGRRGGGMPAARRLGIRSWDWRAVLLTIALVAAAGNAVPPAAAHAVLVSAEPADGAELAASPDRIVLRFNEPVAPIFVRLIDGSGQPVTPPGRIEAMDREVLLVLAAPLPEGRYAVSYRVTSADAHPVSGTVLFSVGRTSGRAAHPATAAESTDATWRTAVVLAWFLRDSALLFTAGSALFLLAMSGRVPASVSAVIHCGGGIGAGVGGAAALLGVGFQGGLLSGLPPLAILHFEVWQIGAMTSAGQSAIAAIAGLALLAVGLRRLPGAWGAGLVLAGACVTLVSLLLTGHAASSEPAWLGRPAWALHGLAAAFWAGSLWPLLIVLRQMPSPAAAPVVARFSRLAVPAVGALIAAGLVIAALQLGSVGALTSTDYGRWLLLKLGLVGLLLLLAANNKLRLTPALAAGDPHAPIRLRRAIRIEIGVLLGVLAVTAVLAQSVPARPPVAGSDPHVASHNPSHGPSHGARPVSAVATAAGRSARFEVAPGVAGPNSVTVALTDAEGAPLEPLELSIALGHPEAGIEPIERTLVATGPGLYRLSDVDLLLPGRWTVRIEALVSDFEKATLTTEIVIR